MSIDTELLRAALDPLAGLALQLLIVLAAIGLFVKMVTKSWKPARMALQWTETLGKIVATQDEINTLVTHELLPNEGGSMKDAICRIDEHVKDLHCRVSRMEDQFPETLGGGS